jgi:phycocyanin beta chain
MTFDAFTRVLAQADSRGDFLSSDQLAGLSALIAEGNKRLDCVNRITAKSSQIVSGAARSLFEMQPQLIQPGGNAYTSRRNASCLRDLDIILRYITYAIYLGDASVLEDRCLNGLRETYSALGVPGAAVGFAIGLMQTEALNLVKDPAGITSGDCSALETEIAQYFARAAMAVQ